MIWEGGCIRMPNMRNIPIIPYKNWKKKVDDTMFVLCGVGAEGMPDFDYYKAWLDGKSPAAAAKEAIRHAKEF